MLLIPRKLYRPLHNSTHSIQLKKLGSETFPNASIKAFKQLEKLDQDLQKDPSKTDEGRALYFNDAAEKIILGLTSVLDAERKIQQTIVESLENKLHRGAVYTNDMQQREAWRLADSITTGSELTSLAKSSPIAAKVIVNDLATRNRLKISEASTELALQTLSVHVLGGADSKALTDGRKKIEIMETTGDGILATHSALSNVVAPIKASQVQEVV